MKVGILTYHRAQNFGALLQAIALRNVLENIGCEVYYIDYWPKYHEDIYRSFSFRRMKSLKKTRWLSYIKSHILYHKIRNKKKDNFEVFINKYILPYVVSCQSKFDVVIYGSDQIWRKQTAIKDYNPVYFGKNDIVTKKHISYAASIGILPKENFDIERVVDLVKNLDVISVREENLCKFLCCHGFKNVKQVVDPTLLLSSKEWEKILPIRPINGKKYVLHYYITKSAFHTKQVRDYAIEHSLEVKEIRGFVDSKESKDLYLTIPPEQFLSLIMNADFVFTSSFHGLVFSLLFHRQFASSFVSNSERAHSLLTLLGLEEFLYPAYYDKSFSNRIIDYEQVDKIINELKSDSINFLKTNLYE